VNVPPLDVSSGSEPEAAAASPEPASLADHAALAGSPARTGSGHASDTRGASASTRTVAVALREALPARSRTIPPTVWEPVTAKVEAASTLAGSTPEPALPSSSAGSPAPAKESVTVSRYQPPPSGARSGVMAGGAGSVRSTTTAAESGDHGPAARPSEARTR
jgi:hypothetical protein